MGVVLGVAGLVHEHVEVIAAADGREHEVHLAGHADRGAERSRSLVRARVEVEVHGGLVGDIDAEPEHRLHQARHEQIGRELPVFLRRPEEPREIRAAQLGRLDPKRSAHLRFEHRGISGVAVGVERGGLEVQRCQVDRLAFRAHLAVAAPPERGGAPVLSLEHLAIEASELALGRLVACPLDRRADLGVGLVGLDDGGLAEAHLPVVELQRQRGLAVRELGLERLGLLAEMPLDGEVEQHPQPAAVVASRVGGVPLLAQIVDRPGGEQLLVAAVDRLDLVRLLEPRVVEVVLPGEVGQERLCRPPIGVDVHRAAILVRR